MGQDHFVEFEVKVVLEAARGEIQRQAVESVGQCRNECENQPRDHRTQRGAPGTQLAHRDVYNPASGERLRCGDGALQQVAGDQACGESATGSPGEVQSPARAGEELPDAAGDRRGACPAFSAARVFRCHLGTSLLIALPEKFPAYQHPAPTISRAINIAAFGAESVSSRAVARNTRSRSAVVRDFIATIRLPNFRARP